MTAFTGPRALLANPDYLRLWLVGGVGTSMRWLEMLAAAIFTFELTGSPFDVAVVTAARALPLLFMGALAGVIGEAVDRKSLLLGGVLVLAGNAGVLALLCATDLVRVWHIALGAAVGGTIWASEMSVRIRMVGEAVPPARIGEAIAFDSLTGNLARMVGPLMGGAIFQLLGIGGAYAASAAFNLIAAFAVIGLAHRQDPRALRLARVPTEILEGLRAAMAQRSLRDVVLVTIVTNFCGFSYSALIAPIGKAAFAASPAWVGVLAAAEPVGAMASALAISAGWLRGDRLRAMFGGSFLLLAGIAAAALAPWYALMLLLLLAGGLGTSAFSTMQGTIILTDAPPALRSRVMGVISMCIGTGPLGILVAGLLSEWLGPSAAMLLMAAAGLAGLVALWCRPASRAR